MSKVRIASLAPADIAYRRMIPAVIKSEKCEYAGVAVRPEGNRERAARFMNDFGGKIWEGYDELIMSDEIDAIYIALPPALHFEWAKKALLAGKHILMEKPATVTYEQAEELINTAKERNLAIHENFAFIYHPQIGKIDELIRSGAIGDIRLIRTNFGFPFRGSQDFRYISELGGGALLDCGCYTLKMAGYLLGGSMTVDLCRLYGKPGFDVDIYGAISAGNDGNVTAQMSFGMDQQYCCNLEVWGSGGYIGSPRIYTAPPELEVKLTLARGSDKEEIAIEPADQFKNSLEVFCDMITDDLLKEQSYADVLRQSRYIDKCMLHKK